MKHSYGEGEVMTRTEIILAMETIQRILAAPRYMGQVGAPIPFGVQQISVADAALFQRYHALKAQLVRMAEEEKSLCVSSIAK